MKNFLSSFLKQSSVGRTLRCVLVACIMVYVICMSAFLPVSTLYFEARAEEEDTFIGVTFDGTNEDIPIEDQDSDLLKGANGEQDTYQEEDNYTNTWDNEINPTLSVVQEEEHLRTVNAKHFRMNDGSYTMVSQSQAIHYKDEDGNYQEIDNTLEKQGNVYKNKANSFEVEIPTTYTKNNKTKVTYGDYRLTFKLDKFVTSNESDLSVVNEEQEYEVTSKNNHKFKVKNQSKAKYKFDNSQVELEQILIGTELKENIILHSTLPSYVFTFDVKAKGLYLTLQESGDIYAISETTEEVIFIIPKGYMFDATGVRSDDVIYELNEIPSGYELKVIADEDWINASERVFPITIDPSVERPENNSFYLASRGAFTASNQMTVSKSIDADTGGITSYIDFQLPTTLQKTMILNAILAFGCTVENESEQELCVWMNQQDVSSSVPSYSYQQMENPKKPGTYIDVCNQGYDAPEGTYMPEDRILISGANNVYTTNFTRWLRQCVETDTMAIFHGVAFSTYGESTILIDTSGIALYITYRNIVGIESYWDYDTYTIGDDSLYVNKSIESITNIHNDLIINSDLPISLQHIYLNSNSIKNYDVDGIFAGVNYGLGWKLNYQEIIRSRESNFEYYDADGTMHYFYYDSEKGYSEDEDGLGLKLYNAVDGLFRMEDVDKNQKWFDYHGRMVKINDKYGNLINIVYGSGNQPTAAGIPITEINDGGSNKIQFVYNAQGYLTSIKYKRPNGTTEATNTYTYDDNGALIKAMNDDGTFMSYSYDSYVSDTSGITKCDLQTIENNDNQGIQIGRNSTMAVEKGLDVLTVVGLEPLVHVLTIQEKIPSSADNKYRHVKDLVYCWGLTLEVFAENGKDYLEFEPSSTLQELVDDDYNAYLEEKDYSNLTPGEQLGVILLLPIIKLAFNIVNQPVYKEMCKPYYEENFIIKNVYDQCGRLVSCYTGNDESISVIESRYGADESATDINKNKITQSTEYKAAIVNRVNNGSFEEDLSAWDGGHVHTAPYQSRTISTKYARQGSKSLLLYNSQPADIWCSLGQFITLAPGTYTLSGYIKIEGMLIPYNDNVDYGAYIRFNVHNGTDYVQTDSEHITTTEYGTQDGFRYVYATVTLPDTQDSYNLYADLVLLNCSGLAYFDDIQLTQNDYASVREYNYADNEGFETWGGELPNNWYVWTDTGLVNSQIITKITDDVFSGTSMAKMVGSYNGSSSFYQRVPIKTSDKAEWYTISMWINNYGKSYISKGTSRVGFYYKCYDADMVALTDFIHQDINSIYGLWQQVSNTFLAPKGTKYIEINIQIRYSRTQLLIDNVSLTESKTQFYDYDSEGKNDEYRDEDVTVSSSEQGNTEVITKDGVAVYSLLKNEYKDVLESVDIARRLKTTYTYDSKGRVTSNTLSSVSGSKEIASTTTYGTLQNGLIDTLTETDSLNFATISNYYSYSDLITKTTFNDGSFVEYQYLDANGTVSSSFPSAVGTIKIINKKADNSVLAEVTYKYCTISDALVNTSTYGYRHEGALKSVTLGNGTVYSYQYDEWGNTTKVFINGSLQVTNTYDAVNGLLISKAYANGYTEYYYYNALYRLESMQAKQDNVLKEHVVYEYDIDGNVVKVIDKLRNKGYGYVYDASGVCYLSNEGTLAQGNHGNERIISEVVYETVFDKYGDVKYTDFIVVDSIPMLSLNNGTQSLSGTMSLSGDKIKQYLKVDDVQKVLYTYSYFGKLIREDNAFLNKTLQYEYDEDGILTNVLVSDYNTTSGAVSYNTNYEVRREDLQYDGEYENLWDAEWMRQNTFGNVDNINEKEDEEYNGVKITNIIEMHPNSFYTGENGYASLVSSSALQSGILGNQVSFWVKIAGTINQDYPNVAVPRIKYSDNSISPTVYMVLNNEWQYFTIDVNPNKTPIRLELPWHNGYLLRIGNMQINTKKQAWDTTWAVDHALGTSDAYLLPQEKISDSNIVTDIVKVHQTSYYTGNFSGTEIYQSLVDPELLENGGEPITVRYKARMDSLNSDWVANYSQDVLNTRIRGLRFRYSDGTSDYAGQMSLEYSTTWKDYSITSAVGKTVVGIELGYNYSTWIRLGNVYIETQGIGQLDSRVTAQTLYNDNYVTYDYDELGRLTDHDVFAHSNSASTVLSENYTFYDNGNTATQLIKSKTVGYATGSITYSYTYNFEKALGDETVSNPYNIAEIYEDGSLKVSYEYDELGRLARENNLYSNLTIIYAYDDNNNLTSKIKYPYTEGTVLSATTTHSYVYGDSIFKDRLTKYSSRSITYDAIGNPVNYFGKAMSWTGRTLDSIGTLTFTYDLNGMRTSKGSTSYLYNGTQLLREINGNNTIWYLYDQSGVVGFELNGVAYYYVCNYLGDVTKVIDTSGNVVVEYTYDSWGKLLSTTGSLATTVGALNPIRYRGYYYDTETKLYYLQSRYYDPETGRFISPDVVAEGGNLYTYCLNDPINRSDESGYLSRNWKIGITIGAAVVVSLAVVAVTVAVGGSIVPVLVGMSVGVVSSAGVSIASQYVMTDDIDWGQVAVDSAVGMVMGSFGGSAISKVGLAIANGVVSAMGSFSADWINGANNIQDYDFVQAAGSGLLSMGFSAFSKGGAQRGLTGDRRAALSTRRTLKANKENYHINNYRFALKSNQGKINRVTKALNVTAIKNILFGNQINVIHDSIINFIVDLI